MSRLGTCLLLALVAGAAAVGARQDVVFSSRAALVLRTVVVVDDAGRPIEGLTADDFVVREDGVVQSLAVVEFHGMRDDALEPIEAATPVGPVPSLVASAIAPGFSSRAADTRYRDRRLLVLYFDMPGLPQADRLRALLSAETFVRGGMTAADLVAIAIYDGGGVRVLQDFTDDRELLRNQLWRLINGEDRDGDGIPDEPGDVGSAFGQNAGEFNFLRTDRQLAALQTAVAMLGPLPEQKTLLYFVSGLTLSGLDNQAQLSATVNAAIRANVTINPIDARGLVADAPLGGANVPSPAGLGAFTGAGAQARRDRFERSQDTLHAMAGDTGGRALFNYNDLALGIRRAASAVAGYYVLGYYTSRPERDGRLRRVTVTVPGRPAARLTYRQAYFAEKEFARFNAADRERQLEEALMLEDPIVEIPMALEINYFQLNRSEYFVPVSAKIPGAALTIDDGGSRVGAEMDVIGEVKDERGVTAQNVRDRLEIPLSAGQAAGLAGRPIQYETGFTLLPGQYAIKLLVRDARSGRIGTYQNTFTIPNLTRATSGVRMSSIVLTSQLADPADVLFGVRQRISAEKANPLVWAGVRYVPSVTRVFSARRGLHVLFYAYATADVVRGPFVAYVSLFKGDVKVTESAPQRIDPSSIVTPFTFTMPLEAVGAGEFECQVSVMDLGGQRVSFWRVPIVVTP